MARAALRLLLHRIRAQRFGQRAHFFRLVPHYHQNLRGLQRLAGAYDVLDQRPASRAMQHFRQIGTHPRSLPSGQNHDHSVGGSHARGIVASPRSFGNRNSLVVRTIPVHSLTKAIYFLTSKIGAA